MRIQFVVICSAVLWSGAALADAGHTHGAAQKYDGHAAAMGEPGDPKARGVRTIEVSMTDKMRFQPATLTIKRGETVRFVVKNTGETKHELVLGTPGELTEHAKVMQKFPEMEHDDPNAIAVEPGKSGSFVWKFTKAGDWDMGFACLIPGHFEAGMKGRVVVR
jgi:uncharacterized cupredoxin-like copper-binding protein